MTSEAYQSTLVDAETTKERLDPDYDPLTVSIQARMRYDREYADRYNIYREKYRALHMDCLYRQVILGEDVILPSPHLLREELLKYGESIDIDDYRPAARKGSCIHYSRTFSSPDDAYGALMRGEDVGMPYTVSERGSMDEVYGLQKPRIRIRIPSRSVYDTDETEHNIKKEEYEARPAPKLRSRRAAEPDMNGIAEAQSQLTCAKQFVRKYNNRTQPIYNESPWASGMPSPFRDTSAYFQPMSYRFGLSRSYEQTQSQPSSPNTVYQNRQNVHKTRIQDTVRQSITNLLTDCKPTFAIEHILGSPDISEQTCSTIRSLCIHTSTVGKYGINFETLLLYVWQRIQASDYRTELIVILTEQLADASDKCFVGYMSRTVAVLAGFYDDIVIEISVQDHIRGIIEAARTSCQPYDQQTHHDLACDRLIGAGYEDEMQSWLEAILDE